MSDWPAYVLVIVLAAGAADWGQGPEYTWWKLIHTVAQ
jgi:hypothetical protein